MTADDGLFVNLELDLVTEDAVGAADNDGAGTDTGDDVDERRAQVLAGVAAAKLDTLQQRVAWLLNHNRDARDSDITLQLLYWEEFLPDLYGGGDISRQGLYRLTRLTSLSRARAKLQNTYKLFTASPDIQRRRGSLGEEERAKAAAQRPVAPLYQVAADESGKNSTYLIWGSVWVLHAPEVATIQRRVGEWKSVRKFDGEFHFKEIDKYNLPTYLAFADYVMSELSSTVTFRSITLERRGAKADSLERMLYHLLVRGVEQEHATGRAPLPRRLQLWKDQEEPGHDRILLADLRDRVEQAAATRFNGLLSAAEFEPLDSKEALLIQLADLYAGSINRILNVEGSAGPKYGFARHFLTALGTPSGPTTTEEVDGLSVHIAL